MPRAKKPAGLVPGSLWAALITIVWQSRIRGTLLGLLGAIVALFAIWQSLPDSEKSRLLSLPGAVFTPEADLEIGTFNVTGTRDDLNWFRVKLERNFVDFFVGQGLRVRHALTTNQAVGANRHYLAGSVVDGDPLLTISVELKDASGKVVGTSQVELTRPDLSTLYRVVPEALVFGMKVSPTSLQRIPGPARRPTFSLAAYTNYLGALDQIHQARFAEARKSLERAIGLDPNFALAVWTIGELSRATGDQADAKVWVDKATAIDPDHPRRAIHPPDRDVQPLPPLLNRMRLVGDLSIESGASYKVVDLRDFNISLHAWSFQNSAFSIKLVDQRSANGDDIKAFLRQPQDVLAVNGGFFDSDSQNRLTPSGLLVSQGITIRGLSEKGSGVLYADKNRVNIVRAVETRDCNKRQWPPEFINVSAESAVQSGPLLVERPGRMGICKPDFDRQNRSAICLMPSSFSIVVVEGGLSLYELAQILSASVKQGGLACEIALNLDGGPSTQAYARHGKHEIKIEGRWRIHNAVVVTKLKP